LQKYPFRSDLNGLTFTVAIDPNKFPAPPPDLTYRKFILALYIQGRLFSATSSDGNFTLSIDFSEPARIDSDEQSG
jgi:hypothetical protein